MDMIFIDSRVGSKELADLIDNSIITTLEYGDISFEGNGPDGKLQVGIERKRVGDMIQSITTGRFAGHQLPGLLGAYDRVYLIVEGQWQANRKTGVIEVWRHGKFKSLGASKFISKRLWGYLISLGALTNVDILITIHTLETVKVIEELHQWWNQKWETHVARMMSCKVAPASAYLVPGKPSLLRRIAMELPGVDTKAIGVEKKFGSVGKMWEATVEEWKEIEGIGKLTAKNVWEELHK